MRKKEGERRKGILAQGISQLVLDYNCQKEEEKRRKGRVEFLEEVFDRSEKGRGGGKEVSLETV